MDQEQQEAETLHQTQRRYQTLLPAIESSPIARGSASDPNPKLPPKRKLVLVACSRCRQKKEKCDGERPSCSRCISKDAECHYEVDDAKVSRTSALKRKCDILEDENERLRELFGFLRQRSKPEAQGILLRIRSTEEPLRVWRSIKDAELLLPWSSSAPGSGTPQSIDPRLEKLDREALADSPVRVKARPWTIVAGDGIVSELLCSFFASDSIFRYPFVDGHCFLEDMATGDPEKARFCSPFLVNAICSMRCYTSARAKAYGAILGEDLAMRFSDEARRLLSLERGRSSLPTAQGLALLFAGFIYNGTDRANMMYRYTSREMLKELNLEARFAIIENDPLKNDEKRAISKALWGFFIYENILACAYLQIPSISPPRIPRLYLETETSSLILGASKENLDTLGIMFGSDVAQDVALVRGTMETASKVAELSHESMQHNLDHAVELGGDDDLRVRRVLYRRILSLINSLPWRLRPESDFTPQGCLLRVFINEVAIGILRPLRPGITLDYGLESVKHLCIKYCQSTVDLLDQYVLQWPLRDYTYMVACGAQNSALTLVAFLDDPTIQDLFTRASGLLDATSRDFPMSIYVLQGLQALAWAMKMEIPPAAVPYLANTEHLLGEEELRDVPVALTIPYADAVRQLVPEDGRRWSGTGLDLGTLLSKWSAMTLE